MAWTTPSTWAAAAVLTASQLNTQLRDNMKAIGDPWVAYTPTLTNWTLSNGTLAGFYMQAGKLVWGKVSYTVGSSDTKSGNLVISLPVTKVADGGAGFPLQGTAELFDTSASLRNYVFVAHNASTSMRFYDGAGNIVVPTVPWTWATGDKLNATFMYEAA